MLELTTEEKETYLLNKKNKLDKLSLEGDEDKTQKEQDFIQVFSFFIIIIILKIKIFLIFFFSLKSNYF